MQKDFSIFKQRREKLVESIKKNYPDKKGLVLLLANFEQERYRFRQESYFYYFTGLEEPAIVVLLDLDSKAVLYAPVYGQSRTKWVQSSVYQATPECLHKWGIDSMQALGESCTGYMLSECALPQYNKLQEDLARYSAQGNALFTLYAQGNYPDQRLIIKTLSESCGGIQSALYDISPIAAQMRRTKSNDELKELKMAVECTMAAHDMVAHMIEPNKREYQVQAAAEFMFTETGAQPAFPSIVAAGKNSTVLHYTSNKSLLKQGDLVLVDIGAEYHYYCGDITRTYPVTGVFTKRQRQLYTLVLETQQYLEELLKPGLWLKNNAQPDKSVHHMAIKFLEKSGYSQYFTHGIGHYLGLDVHDVGDYSKPLQEGDVITLEPGIYIPQESTGIRIEDDYLLVSGGTVCLSGQLPKIPELIEELMASSFEDELEERQD